MILGLKCREAFGLSFDSGALGSNSRSVRSNVLYVLHLNKE